MTDFVPLPPHVLFIIDRLTKAGFRADIVGGCVRDILLGTTPHDYDITTAARPEDMHRIFFDVRTVDTGIRHGTLTVFLDKIPYEITTYRVDGTYVDHRHPDSVSFTDRLSDDLSRRDFTMNAICYHPIYGFTDLFGGQEDIKRRLIRAVGYPARRFEEDALRILRALRFSSMLGFEIEKDTAIAVEDKRELLPAVSAERIYSELMKLLGGADAHRVLTQYPSVFASALPEAVTENLPSFAGLCAQLRFISLFVRADRPTDAFLRATERLHTDAAIRRRGTAVLSHLGAPCRTRRDLLYLLRSVGEAYTKDVLSLGCAFGLATAEDRTRLSDLLSENPVYTVSGLALDGHDCRGVGLAGKDIGAALDDALTAVTKGVCPNEKDKLLSYIRMRKEEGNYGV